jgi:hypothetical protein
MGNIYFQKIQISGPAMNFVLEPQSFSGKNWNSPINTGRRSPTTSIPSRYMRQVHGVNWTVLYSTTTTGNVAEVLTSISSNLTTGNYQQHRFGIQSQGQPIAVAQAQFSAAVTGVNEE